MATFDNVVFPGYQILSSDMGSSENVNLQGGKVKAHGAFTITLPISFDSPICVCLTDILPQPHYGYAPNFYKITETSLMGSCGYNGVTEATLWIAFGI